MHLALFDPSNTLCAAMPLYLKGHSYGEYVFDWAWAQAYERAGLAYYPKLLCAIPFTPVKAPKLLAADAQARETLAHGLMRLAQQSARDADTLGICTSGLHVLFMEGSDEETLCGRPSNQLTTRHVVQFHLENHFKDFEQFLGSLHQKKRKNIRAERRKAQSACTHIVRVTGHGIQAEQLEFFYACYSNTYRERHSSPYLTFEFFKQVCASMGEQVLFCIAYNGETPLASSFFLFNEERLYGRYWGALQQVDCLHFELCYYQAIEFAIERNIRWFEGGAQGEHKMARGLNPQVMHSAHWVEDDGFREAIGRFVSREKTHLDMYASELAEHVAFKNQDAL